MRRRDDIEGPVLVAPARFVRLGPVAEAATGITRVAMQRKIDKGEWQEGREYVVGPDHRRYIDLRAFEAWVMSALTHE